MIVVVVLLAVDVVVLAVVVVVVVVIACMRDGDARCSPSYLCLVRKRSRSRKVGQMEVLKRIANECEELPCDMKLEVGKVPLARLLESIGQIGRYYANIAIILTILATEQTPGTPADMEATMQDPGNAPPLRSSGPGAEPDAATEHIVVEAEGSIHARILDTPSSP